MASNKITEGVGKKIVEALKKQSDIEIIPVPETPVQSEPVQFDLGSHEVEYINEPAEDEVAAETNYAFSHDESFVQPQPQPLPAFNNAQPQQSVNVGNFTNILNNPVETISNELEGFEIPTNVAVLKQLISKLPSGVTKQTGAQIIKQTMEALGISMSSVLQEAQQVQEGLNASARDCQTTIVEYRNQINLLEKQAQKYQRQFAALNDIISLFIQTNH